MSGSTSIILRSYHRALIIGNGFDLNCGYKTSYNDFFESEFFKSIEKNNTICKQLKFTVRINKWLNVENELMGIYKDSIELMIDVCET